MRFKDVSITLSVGSSWFSLLTPVLRRLLWSATFPDSDAICCWKTLCSSPKLYGVLVEEATILKYHDSTTNDIQKRKHLDL
jgi:hypothetical protein